MTFYSLMASGWSARGGCLGLVDLGQIGEVGLAHIAARQELREMIAGLGIADPGAAQPEPVAAAG